MKEANLDEIEKSEAQGTYLKWPGPHTLQFVHGPEIRRRHWVGQVPEDCAGEGCAMCAQIEGDDDPRRLKVSYLYECRASADDEDVVMFDLSAAAQRELTPIMRTFRDEYGEDGRSEFGARWFRCERTGQGRSTRYRFTEVKAKAKAKAKAVVVDEDEIPF